MLPLSKHNGTEEIMQFLHLNIDNLPLYINDVDDILVSECHKPGNESIFDKQDLQIPCILIYVFRIEIHDILVANVATTQRKGYSYGNLKMVSTSNEMFKPFTKPFFKTNGHENS
jgi:hypothetical protein